MTAALDQPADLVIEAERVFDGQAIRERCFVSVRHGRIHDLTTSAPPARRVSRLPPSAILAPGFVDLQVNGGGGVLFNDDRSVGGIARIAAAHRRVGGTTSLLPTLISDTRAVIRSAIEAIRDARLARIPGIRGIHLEGPFLSPHRPGIHDPARLAQISEGDIALLTGLADAGVTLITLAPEAVPPGTVASLVAHGARVCAGHTADDGTLIAQALDEGLTGFTHLYNAMTQFGSRVPGAVGIALTEPRAFAGIIADGHHVAPHALAVALRMKGAKRLMLVSDAMPSVGARDEAAGFTLFGRRIRCESGRLTAEDGTLAGAHLTMAGAVRHMIAHGGASLEEALAMASLTPACFLGLNEEIGRIAPGYEADLVVLDEHLNPLGTWIAGESEADPARPDH